MINFESLNSKEQAEIVHIFDQENRPIADFYGDRRSEYAYLFSAAVQEGVVKDRLLRDSIVVVFTVLILFFLYLLGMVLA